ncbi:MAG: (deoxy)nucleoside triphosphate pyrophosphohydrolase [Pseudomonadota bacterium]
MTTKLILVVAAAIYNEAGEILLAKRPDGKAMAGLWELPGGKIETGETPEEALARELGEELSIMVNPDLLEPITFASHSYESFHLLMPVYACLDWDGALEPRESQEISWVAPHLLHTYPAPAADKPLFETLAAQDRSGTHAISQETAG